MQRTPTVIPRLTSLPSRLSRLALCLSVIGTAYATPMAVTTSADDSQIERISVQGRRINNQMSEPTRELLNVAGSMHDPMAAVFSLPGVVYGGGDYGSLPAVRGSSPSDNAFLIDDMPAGYLFHMFGNSIFQENLLQDFELDAAAFSSQYGNATGGVFRATLRNPKTGALQGEAELSGLQAGMLVEGSINDQQSFFVSARRSTLDLFMKKGDELDDGISIYKPPVSDDYQARFLWQPSVNQLFTVTLLGASDQARINISKSSEQGRTDPETVGDASLSTSFDNQQLHYQLNTNLMRWDLRYQHSNQQQTQRFGRDQFVDVQDEQHQAKLENHWQWTDAQMLISGVEWTQRDADYAFDIIPYYCTDHQADCFDQRGERVQDRDTLRNTLYSGYLQHQWQFANSWQIEVGVRVDKQRRTDEQFVQPRAKLMWELNDNHQLYWQAGRYSQQADVEKTLPLLGNPKLEQPRAIHYLMGHQWQLSSAWQFRTELYRKYLQALPRAMTDLDTDNALHFSNDASGVAEGVELLLKKQKQDLDWYGWASFSYSRSNRTDERLQQTARYHLDTPLVANLVFAMPLDELWDLSARLTVRSGARYTPIIGKKPNPYVPGHQVAVYGELNSAKLPVYHRLDVQAEYKTDISGYDTRLTLAVINLINRKNVSGYFLQQSTDGTRYDITPEEDIGIMPSLGIKVKF